MPYLTPTVREALQSPTAGVFLTEGEKKALAVTQHIGPCIGLTGIDCWHRAKSAALLPDLAALTWKGRSVRIVFDAPANDDVRRAESELAAALKREGAEVKIIRLPPGPNGEKVGVDDFIVANGVDAFWRLVDAAEEPTPVDGEDLRRSADAADPAVEAKAFLRTGEQDGLYRLRYYRGGFLLWSKGAYREVQDSEVRLQVVKHLDKHLTRLGRSKTGDVLMHVQAHSLLPGQVDAPGWLLDAPHGWRARDVIATPTQIVHVPSLFDGKPSTTTATPNLFTMSAVDYDFDEHAPPPKRWHEFLRQLWPDDTENRDTLQELFGYALAGSTDQHKIFLLIGPMRSGKGTIARVLEAMVGKRNCVSPTLGSLTGNFGLQPLLGKSLAIISDARLSRRTDQATVLERLLSISGEDQQTVDIKFREPVTGTLPIRFVILTNELPRLDDSSGAFASRLILFRFTESFLGREDHGLTAALLQELPGILIWAISGWQRLKDRGCFLQPASGKELLAEMEELVSPVAAFMRECCRRAPEGEIARRDLHAAYLEWCRLEGKHKPDDAATFGRNLHAAAPFIKSGQKHNGERIYRGIALK